MNHGRQIIAKHRKGNLSIKQAYVGKTNFLKNNNDKEDLQISFTALSGLWASQDGNNCKAYTAQNSQIDFKKSCDFSYLMTTL